MEILSIRLIYILQLVLRLHLPPTLCSHIEGGPCKGGGHRFLSGQWQWKQSEQQHQGPPTPPFIYWRTQKQQQHQRRRKNNQMDSADHPRRRRRGPRMSLRRRRGSQPVLRGKGRQGVGKVLAFRRHVLAGQQQQQQLRRVCMWTSVCR